MTTATLILQIVTIAVSVISMALGFLNTFKENRKKHYIEIVTQQRLKNKAAVQQAAKILLEFTHESVVTESNAESLLKCAEAASEISVILKSIYPEDNNLITSADSVVGELKKYIDSGMKSCDNLLSARERFYKEYSVYDLSDWRFIKSQAYGNATDSDDFDEIYNSVQKQYSEN